MPAAVAFRHVPFEDLGLLGPLLDRRGWRVSYRDAAVDAFAARPLYYTHRSGRLAFASTLRALLALPGTPVDLHEGVLTDVLAYTPRHSGATLYRAISALRAFEHARSVYPFGAELHYTDDRPGADPAALATEVGEYLKASGFADAEAHPVPAGIEDSFMLRMGAPEGEAG